MLSKQMLFAQGGLFSRTRTFAAGVCSGRVSVRGECLTGDDSIAYDRSTARLPQQTNLRRFTRDEPFEI